MPHADPHPPRSLMPGLGNFPTTRWSVIASARGGSEAGLARLCEGYRSPLIAYLLAQGIPAQDVEDVAHGFFAALLSRDFLGKVSEAKGRFRTWLLRAIEYHLCDAHDKRHALKRGGGQPVRSLQETGRDGQPLYQPVDPQTTPDALYGRRWAEALIARAWTQVVKECAAARKRKLLTELEPVLWQDDSAPDYRTIATRLGISEAAVKTGAKRIRDRLRWLIRDQVRRTVEHESEFEAELRDLIAFAAGPTSAMLGGCVAQPAPRGAAESE